MGSTLVSVIIPAFNAAPFLERCIESVLSQSIATWELIIVNDGSTDSTATLCEQAAAKDRRVRCIHQPNSGLSAARNAGLKAAEGGFVQFLDADDTLLPRKLEASLQRFEARPDLDIVVSEVASIGSDGHHGSPVQFPDSNYNAELWERNFLVVNAPMVRMSLIRKVGYFCTEDSASYSLYGCEDWQYWLRCSLANMQWEILSEVLVHNFRHDQNMSSKTIEMHLSELWCLDSMRRWCIEQEPSFEVVRQTSLLYRVARGLGILEGPKYNHMVSLVERDPLVRAQAILGTLLRQRRLLPPWMFQKLCHGLSKVYFLRLKHQIKQIANREP